MRGGPNCLSLRFPHPAEAIRKFRTVGTRRALGSAKAAVGSTVRKIHFHKMINGPRIITQDGLKHSPKVPQVGPKMAEDRTRLAQDGPKMDSGWPWGGACCIIYTW